MPIEAAVHEVRHNDSRRTTASDSSVALAPSWQTQANECSRSLAVESSSDKQVQGQPITSLLAEGQILHLDLASGFARSASDIILPRLQARHFPGLQGASSPAEGSPWVRLVGRT